MILYLYRYIELVHEYIDMILYLHRYIELFIIFFSHIQVHQQYIIYIDHTSGLPYINDYSGTVGFEYTHI